MLAGNQKMEAAGVWAKCKVLMRKEPEAPAVVHEDEDQVVIYDPSDMFADPSKKRKLWSDSREFNTKCKKRLVRVTAGANENNFTLRFNDQLVALPGNAYNTARERLRSKSCTKCSFVAHSPKALEIHVRKHTGERPHKCDQCKFTCSQKDNLQKHTRTHTGEKPHKCDYCYYASSTQDHLKTHIRTHTGEKPYKCDYCDFACSIQGHLKTHIRTHTGEKPYKCDYCDFACS